MVTGLSNFILPAGFRLTTKADREIIRVRVAQKNCVTIAAFFGHADLGKHSASV